MSFVKRLRRQNPQRLKNTILIYNNNYMYYLFNLVLTFQSPVSKTYSYFTEDSSDLNYLELFNSMVKKKPRLKCTVFSLLSHFTDVQKKPFFQKMPKTLMKQFCLFFIATNIMVIVVILHNGKSAGSWCFTMFQQVDIFLSSLSLIFPKNFLKHHEIFFEISRDRHYNPLVCSVFGWKKCRDPWFSAAFVSIELSVSRTFFQEKRHILHL